MIKQEIIYHPGTYIEKSFKEFSDGKLISHIKYDKLANKIYYENSYGEFYKFNKMVK